jgi:hypothetical protein
MMQDVYSVLSNLEERKSSGPDGIPNVLLKRCKQSLALPLSILYNKSLHEGYLQQDWRDAIVAPIHKKGSKTKAENYRPVSLTSTVVKVIEKIINKHIVAHLDKYSLIHDSQYGFRRNLNCEYQLVHYLDTVTKLLDDGHNVDVLYLDMQKAFDKVSHNYLLNKLGDEFHIGGNVMQWLKAYLNNRRQRVRIGTALSEWSVVTSGVPQGSILGPILFIMYVNDIDGVLNLSNIYKFADDTKVLSIVNTKEDCRRFQQNIDALTAWSEKWKMPYNSQKSAVIHFGKNNPQFSYIMNGTCIPVSSVERDLGILIDNKLCFDAHINSIVGRARRLCGWIRRVYTTKNTVVLLRLYTTIVRPILEYASVIWSPFKASYINEIEKVQRQFTKRIRAVNSLCYDDRLSQLGLQSLTERRNISDIHVTCSLLTSNFQHLRALFRMRKEVCARRTRGHALRLEHVRCKCSIRQHFVTNRVVNTWNNLTDAKIRQMQINTHFTGHRWINSNAFVPSVM